MSDASDTGPWPLGALFGPHESPDTYIETIERLQGELHDARQVIAALVRQQGGKAFISDREIVASDREPFLASFRSIDEDGVKIRAMTAPDTGPTNSERLMAAQDVRILLAKCRDGSFYEDHDESWELLTRAEKAMEVLS